MVHGLTYKVVSSGKYLEKNKIELKCNFKISQNSGTFIRINCNRGNVIIICITHVIAPSLHRYTNFEFLTSANQVLEKSTGERVITSWEKMSKSKYNGVNPQVS